MRIAIIGVGAMGGLWAARLSRVVEDVWAVDASPDLVRAIDNQGIRVEGAGDELTARVRATTRLADVPEPDLVFVFVKAQHTASVASALGATLSPGTTVVTLQNGLGNADILLQTVPIEQLLVGVTYQSATLTAPGIVRNNSAGGTWLGPASASGDLDRASRVADVMTQAGFETTATPTVLTEVWRKLVLNASGLAVSALTGLRPGEMADEAEVLALVEGLAAEAVDVARASGHDVSLEERLEVIRRILPAAGMGKGSMLQDVEARRKTEVEVINGAVVRLGRTVGVATPLNQGLLALVQGLERSWRR